MPTQNTVYTLSTPLKDVKYIGPKITKYLQDKGIYTIQDLWNYFPYRYEDTSNIISISKLYEYYAQQQALFNLNPELKSTIIGIVEKTELIISKRRKNFQLVRAIIKDQYSPNEKIVAIWFNQKHVLHNLKKNSKVVIYGSFKKVGSHLETQNPQYELYNLPLTHLGRITPVYERTRSISSKMLRRYIAEIKPTLGQFKEYIPTNILAKHKLVPLPVAYKNIHFPNEPQDIKQGYTRLFIQELLELLAYQQENKLKPTTALSASQVALLKKEINNLIPHLPFQLTADQHKAVDQITTNLTRHTRFFLYGDVGSGKTIVYLLLALGITRLGYSSILMAPTGILAQQHYNTLIKLMKQLPQVQVDPLLITTKQRKTKVIRLIKPSILIGTHALMYKNFEWDKHPPILIGVDEEHKFGIFQREHFIRLVNQLGMTPYQLSLSATPIPRTLALTFYNYQASVYIHEKPKGNKPVSTYVVPPSKLKQLIEWLKQHIAQGHQAFIVFPRIEGEQLEEYPLIIWYDILTKDYGLDALGTTMIHGRMTEKQKQEAVEKFREGNAKILFSTTIIEVGIDIPQATAIIIFGPELLGLAQLHQLRGRVGRNNEQSYCYLVSFNTSPNIQKRLRFFAKTTDGLKIAEYDLEHRGPGDLLIGKEQHGFKRFKIANLGNYYLVNLSLKVFNELKTKGITIPTIISKRET